MSLKYPEARGGFLKFHPPPAYKNTALFWTEVYVGLLIINIPPPKFSQFYNPDMKQKYEEKRINR